MDKRTLTKEELAVLKQFIISRSTRFAEPAILLEITDHFACKTEELLSAEPSLTLEAAMKRAHHAFGVKGFTPIAAAFEQQCYQQYKHFYYQTLRSILLSAKSPALLGIALFFAQAYTLTDRLYTLPLVGFEFVLLLEMAYAACVLLIWFRSHNRKRHPLITRQAYRAGHHVLYWLWLGLIVLPLREVFSSWFPAIIGVSTFLLSLQLLSLYRLRRKLDADIDAIDQRTQLSS